MINSKWSPRNIFQPSPTWVKVMRWMVITLCPLIAGQVPMMPVHADTKYWILFFNTLLGSLLIALGEGFKTKTLNERATERNAAEMAIKKP